MHPQMNPADRSYSPTPEMPHHHLSQSGSGVIISRVDSSLRAAELEGLLTNSSSSGHIRRDTPIVIQHKGYGAAATGNNEISTKI